MHLSLNRKRLMMLNLNMLTKDINSKMGIDWREESIHKVNKPPCYVESDCNGKQYDTAKQPSVSNICNRLSTICKTTNKLNHQIHIFIFGWIIKSMPKERHKTDMKSYMLYSILNKWISNPKERHEIHEILYVIVFWINEVLGSSSTTTVHGICSSVHLAGKDYVHSHERGHWFPSQPTGAAAQVTHNQSIYMVKRKFLVHQANQGLPWKISTFTQSLMVSEISSTCHCPKKRWIDVKIKF